MRRVEELCRTAETRNIPRYTGFLSDREQSLAQAAANRAQCRCLRFWGGCDGAGRGVGGVEVGWWVCCWLWAFVFCVLLVSAV